MEILPFIIVVECDNLGGVVFAMDYFNDHRLTSHAFRFAKGNFRQAHDEAVNDAKRYLQQEQMKKVYRQQALDELCDKLFN